MEGDLRTQSKKFNKFGSRTPRRDDKVDKARLYSLETRTNTQQAIILARLSARKTEGIA